MGKRTVTVVGSGRASVTPDVVRLDLRVGHDASDVAAALSGASAGIRAVRTVVREQGVAPTDLRTLDAGVSQRWDGTGSAIGFTAYQRLGVTVRDLEAVGRILESAAAAVGNALLVDQVHLDVSDRTAGLREARDGAFADARAKAVQYAALSGSSLGVVLGLAEAGAAASGGGGRDMRMMAMASAAEGMPVEGGDLDLAASITVTWELTTG
ncbi:MAG: SIMPL domain-containing protein [Humibacillus sp.]